MNEGSISVNGKDFNVGYQFSNASPSFVTIQGIFHNEGEIDFAIKALKINQKLLRGDVNPLPRNMSLVVT